MDYRYGSHTVFKIQYHFVFVTKYRYQVLRGDVGLRARELIRETCQAFEIEIVNKDVAALCKAPDGECTPSEPIPLRANAFAMAARDRQSCGLQAFISLQTTKVARSQCRSGRRILLIFR